MRKKKQFHVHQRNSCTFWEDFAFLLRVRFWCCCFYNQKWLICHLSDLTFGAFEEQKRHLKKELQHRGNNTAYHIYKQHKIPQTATDYLAIFTSTILAQCRLCDGKNLHMNICWTEQDWIIWSGNCWWAFLCI